jgi:hypothetical protein
MPQHNRDEDKKRRRKKRLEKRARANRAGSEKALGQVGQVLANVERQLELPEPARWPGAADPSLARPDLVKLELARFATEHSPGREKLKRFEADCRKGLLHALPEVDHWSWEEFIYHGLPGDSWHPIEAYLAQAGDRYPPAAAAQLRRWKEARVGLYEIGEVADDTLALREWDAVRDAPGGSPMRAITLNIGGVNAFRQLRGKLLLSYVAPWLPDDNLYCGMGYSKPLEKSFAQPFLAYLALRHPDVVGRPLPWNVSRAAEQHYLREWRGRDWQGWLQEQLTFPFAALVTTPPAGVPRLLEVRRLLPSTADRARVFGIYFEVPQPGRPEVLAAGGTHVVPLDITSRNRLALAEYHAFRDRAGQPPGVRGRPTFFEL